MQSLAITWPLVDTALFVVWRPSKDGGEGELCAVMYKPGQEALQSFIDRTWAWAWVGG